MAPKQKLTKYGLHNDPNLGVWWLIQENIQSAIGLPTEQFKYKPPSFGAPHAIDLSAADFSGVFKRKMTGIEQYPIFRAMMPIPNNSGVKTTYIEVNNMRDVASVNVLQQMFTPNRTCCLPINLAKHYNEFISQNLNSSNLMRLLLTGADSSTLPHLNMIVPLAMGAAGDLIITGQKIPDYNYRGVVNFLKVDPLWTDKILEFGSTEDFNKLGAHIISKFMRGESCKRL